MADDKQIVNIPLDLDLFTSKTSRNETNHFHIYIDDEVDYNINGNAFDASNLTGNVNKGGESKQDFEDNKEKLKDFDNKCAKELTQDDAEIYCSRKTDIDTIVSRSKEVIIGALNQRHNILKELNNKQSANKVKL